MTLRPDISTTLRTDTPDEQRAHYPLITARRAGRLWDDRTAWTANRRQANSITAAEIRNSVSTTAADYATNDEIDTAIIELNAIWARAGKDLRTANKAADAVFPQRRHLAGHVAHFDAYEALSPEDQAVVDYAGELRDARREVHNLARVLQRFGTVERRRVRSVDLIGDSCPAFTAIVVRIAAAGEQAVAEYVARIQSLPVDNEAWARELASREEREAWFRNGPVVRHFATREEMVQHD